jgi:hypothetical protein
MERRIKAPLCCEPWVSPILCDCTAAAGIGTPGVAAGRRGPFNHRVACTLPEDFPMRPALLLLSLSALLGAAPALWAADNEPPAGFEALFNGKDLTGWKVNKGGKMEAWGAENGLLYVNGGGGGWLMTQKEYGDFELRLEFKLPEKGNSGVALRSAMEGNPAFDAGMEIQLLDDEWHRKNLSDLKVSQLTGSIYGIQGPSKDALKPVGQWNSLRIVAKGKHITIELNGVKTVDADLAKYKNKEKEHPGMLHETGHLGLQSHDGRVEFRNLYVKPL